MSFSRACQTGKSWTAALISERAGIQTIVLGNEDEFAASIEDVDVVCCSNTTYSAVLLRAEPR